MVDVAIFCRFIHSNGVPIRTGIYFVDGSLDRKFYYIGVRTVPIDGGNFVNFMGVLIRTLLMFFFDYKCVQLFNESMNLYRYPV